MLKWVQSGLSAVAGTAEPEYGKEAIHPVTESTSDGKIYREATMEDITWKAPSSTNVETQTFYFTCLKTGYIGFAQIIHSSMMGVHTTAQFTFRFYNSRDPSVGSLWTSTKLEEFRVEGASFYAKNLSVEVDPDNTTYTILSLVNPESLVELKVVKGVPGIIFGKDGTTYYGDDVANPWGSMSHVFWPRCEVTGSVSLHDVKYEIEGLTMFVKALQGMKPHHAAKSWNFLNFQSENFSAVQMEFTTPKSYANTKVNIGIITSKDGIISCSMDNEVVHERSEVDEVGWPVPKAITFNFTGGETYRVTGELNTLVERVDVMAEIPQFIKNIASGVAGAKPFIYQFCNEFQIEVEKLGKETGIGFNEATFISD